MIQNKTFHLQKSARVVLFQRYFNIVIEVNKTKLIFGNWFESKGVNEFVAINYSGDLARA